jgi:excisionase family DNA binding protein
MSKIAFSIEEAAEATGYSTDTIRRALRRGDMTARYANSKPVILATELKEWLEALPTEAPSR